MSNPRSFVDDFVSKVININRKQFIEREIHDTFLSYEPTHRIMICASDDCINLFTSLDCLTNRGRCEYCNKYYCNSCKLRSIDFCYKCYKVSCQSDQTECPKVVNLHDEYDMTYKCCTKCIAK